MTATHPAAVVCLALALLTECQAALRSDVYRTTDALERLAQFLAMHKEGVTLDHALGAVMAQAQVQGTLRALQALQGAGGASQERSNLVARLGTAYQDLDGVVRAAEAVLLAAPVGEHVGLRLLHPWLWQPGTPDPSYHPQDRPQPAAAPGGGDLPSVQAVLELRELSGLGSPSEGQSAFCIAAVLQSAPAPTCSVPPACSKAETEGGSTGYTATHRLLFHHLANQMGCREQGEEVGSSDTIALLCRSILGEAMDIAQAGYPPLLRDLFAEQVALCGMRDFTVFAQPAWLDEMLSWQRPAGCFGNFTELQEAVLPFRVLRDNARLDDRLGSECLSHLTGVAAAALAFNLRVLVQSWLQTNP